jgi:GNAT superfamily N-acetyltransferase
LQGNINLKKRAGYFSAIMELRAFSTFWISQDLDLMKALTLQPLFAPLTPDRWPDLEALFGPKGACGGCWCMYWRLSRQEFEDQKGEINRLALRTLVEKGAPTGILAYVEDKPVGWCALAPREHFPTLGRSRILRPVDDVDVWSINCFYISRPFRKQGITIALIEAAVAYAHHEGAAVIEAYPVEPKGDKVPDVFVYTGLFSAFLQAGFKEVARRSATRPIVRFFI